MPRVHFTANLQRYLPAPSVDAAGASVRQVLERVFAEHPALRGYVLDEHGSLRKHMAIFVDGEIIADRAGLSDPVAANADIYVMQALSGG